MYIFKNALKSISRSKGRNILIGVIVLVIAAACTVSLSIKEASKTAEEEGLKNLSITATIGINREAIMNNSSGKTQEEIRTLMQSYGDLSLTDLQKYAASEYVQSFIYSLSTTMSASGTLEPYNTSSSTESGNSNSSATQQPPMGGFGDFSGKSIGDFTLTGYNSEDAMTDFVNGTSTITDGAMFDVTGSDLKCIISNELAVFNSLKVGDAIILANPNNTSETYTFTVAGIYTNSSAGSTTSGRMRFSTAQDAANQIYTSYNALGSVISASNAVSTDTALSEQINGSYVFASVENYNSFTTAVYDMGLDQNYAVSSSDLNSYEQSLLPLKNLSKFATTMLIVVLGIGALILIVFNIYSIRERKYEVGVLTAIGMKKKKVALQFMTEIFAVTIIALIIGVGAGAAISGPTANKLLESQIQSQQTQMQQRNANFGRANDISQNVPSDATGVSRVNNYISSINAVTDLSVVAGLLGIGILLTLISSSAAVIFILRYEPLKILSDRT